MNKRYRTVRKIISTGASHEANEAFQHLARNGYSFISLHPKALARGRKNFSKFKMIGEKVVAAKLDD